MPRSVLILSIFLLSHMVSAAELTSGGTTVTHTRQGLLSSASGVGANSSNYNLELTGQRVVNDIFSFQFSVPLVPGALSSVTKKFTCDRLSVDSDSVDFGYLDGDEAAGTVRYRMIRTSDGSATDGFSPQGLHCVTPIVQLDPQALATAGVATLTVQLSTLYGIDIQKVGPVTVANVIDAFTVSVGTPFDGVVDVATDKRSFVGSAVENSADSLGLTLTLADGTAGDLLTKNAFAAHTVAGGAAPVAPVTSSGVIITVEGDFSFLDTNQATDGMQLGGNTVNIDNHTISFSSDLTSLIASNFNANIATGANNYTLKVTKKEATGQLIDQTFSGQLQVYFDGNRQSVMLPLTSGAGSWGWNGTEVMVYAMPFDENVTRVLGVSNQGSYEFDVTAEVHADGLVHGPYALGVVGANSIGQFGALLDQAISESGDEIGAARANVVLRASVSQANLMVYGGYRVDSDLTLVNLYTSAQSNLVTP